MAKLRRRKNRGNRYFLDYRDPGDNGRRYQVDTGCIDPKEARRWLRKFEDLADLVESGEIEKIGKIDATIVEGRMPKKEDKKKGIRMSEYQKIHEGIARDRLGLAEKTIENYRLAFASYIKVKGDQCLDEIEPSDVLSWGEELRSQGKSKTTQSMLGRALKSALNRALEYKFLKRSDNPFKVPYPTQRETRRTDKTMKFEEVQALLSYIDSKGEREAQFGRYVRCLLYTGCRRNEILKLKGEDVDLENRILKVTVTKKRGGPIKMQVPINKALYQVLSKMEIKAGEYLFKTTSRKTSHREKGNHWSPYYVSEHLRELMDKLGFPEQYSLHSIRKSYISHLHGLGVPIDVIQRLVGHSSPTITWLEYSTTDALSYRKYADMIDFDSVSLEQRLEDPKPDTNSENPL